MVLTFLERLSHNSLSENRKRETLDACMRHMGFKSNKYRILLETADDDQVYYPK